MKLAPHEIVVIIFYLLVLFQPQAHAAVDIRYLPDGVEIARNADGSIKRSAKVLADFQKIHPCPSTGLTTGKCPGWKKDHVAPMACRGRDVVENMQWLPDHVKAAKDAFERKIYAINGFVSGGCRFLILPQVK